MIRVENLSKFYGGARALGPVTFEIDSGETVGFLGLNGAGKTTALRILACDLRPSGGTVSVDGVDAIADPHEVRKRIGFLPEAPPLYQDMTVTDYLRFAGRLRGMSTAAVRKRLPEVLARTDLEDRAGDLIGHLSHGYRQRVGVAQAIVHEPSLLILDEHTRGLDPVQIVEMRNMINELKEAHTILISSHILTEISRTCDRLLVLGKGEIVATGTEDELTASMREAASSMNEVSSVTVTVRPKGTRDGDDGEDSGDGGGDQIRSLLEAIDGVLSVSSRGLERERAVEYHLQCNRDLRAEASRAVIEAGHDLIGLERIGLERGSLGELEQTFVKLVGGSDAHD
ncbi:ABC transporter ATP-binding protein [Haliangium sp.]|uniref:ABC transporter ATP-binding protein n=1 Tax=Haliangium sp. TaxID=2663208 RepID=UPI003D0E8751